MTQLHALTPRTARPDPLVARLDGLVRSTLSGELEGVRRVALVDFPNHPNIGDSAIWLGEVAVLRSLGIEVVYACDQRSYVPAHLRAALGADGAILLHGGGNLGDLYPLFQRLRERILADFPGHLTLQLPQTVARMSPDTEARMRRLVQRHERLRVLARDAATQRWFGDRLGLEAPLCPDSAFCLGARQVPPGEGVLWLARTDDESVGGTPTPPPGVRVADWPRPTFLWHRRRMVSRRASFAVSTLPVGGRFWRPATGLYARLAGERLATGIDLLAGAGAVVTDRLHAHILSLLCGVPHVLRDNATGKLRGCYEQWTGESPLAHWSESDDEALATARQLADARMDA